jgi:hypothetical protein
MPGLIEIGGATGNRTPDLYNAIVALSHLSYDPEKGVSSAVRGTLAPKFASGEPRTR